MNFRVLRNKKQLLDYCEYLMKSRLPKKVADQDIYPLRSLESNAYYWGIVLKYISDATGDSQEKCHDGYKLLFNFNYDIEYNPKTNMYEWVMGVKSTANQDDKVFWDFVMRVRIDGELEHHIVIPMPNEVFVNELKFEKEI